MYADSGGQSPSRRPVIEAQAREADRERPLAELEPPKAVTARTAQGTDAALRRALRAELDDWRGSVEGDVERARQMLDGALGDRLTFTRPREAEGAATSGRWKPRSHGTAC